MLTNGNELERLAKKWESDPAYHSHERTSGIIRGSSEVWFAAAGELRAALAKWRNLA